MRFSWKCGALLGLTLGMAVTPSVFGSHVECWPYGDCFTYTADFSGNATNELTPWTGQINLPKFDTQGGDRVLTGVKIKTKVYAQTKLFVVDLGGPSFTGTLHAGVMFNVDLASPNSGTLGQYWGRWGDYTEGLQQGIDQTDVDPNDYTTNTKKLFIPYTYPLFDVIGAIDCIPGGTDPLTLCPSGHPTLPADYLPLSGTPPIQDGAGGPVFAYYAPSPNAETLGWGQYYYGTVSRGTYVVKLDDNNQGGTEPYYLQYYDPLGDLGFANEFSVTVDSKVTDFTTEQQVGVTSMSYYTDALAFSKSITSTDYPDANGAIGGGLTKDILPATVLALFEGTGNVTFDASATGLYTYNFVGGNAGARQQTSAKIAIRIEYTYDCTGCTFGDPQFGGFQGQSFQVHGYPGSYFNLFSAPSFQLNGRFTYLASGHCKYNHTQCWTHPGTYIDDLAFVVDELLIRVIAGPVGSGYSVLINNEPFHAHQHANVSDVAHGDDREFIATKFYDPNTRTTVHLKSPLEVVVRTELVSFSIHNADHFFNLDSQLLVRPLMKLGRSPSASYPDPLTGKPGFPSYPIHGFIGQTWANKKYPHNRLYQGEPDDYVEPKPYSTESLYSQYAKEFDDKQAAWTQQ